MSSQHPDDRKKIVKIRIQAQQMPPDTTTTNIRHYFGLNDVLPPGKCPHAYDANIASSVSSLHYTILPEYEYKQYGTTLLTNARKQYISSYMIQTYIRQQQQQQHQENVDRLVSLNQSSMISNSANHSSMEYSVSHDHILDDRSRNSHDSPYHIVVHIRCGDVHPCTYPKRFLTSQL
jgi:hypothetical protein